MFAVGNRIKLRPYMGGDNLTEGKVYEVINTILSLNKVTITNDLAIKEMVPAWLFELVLTPQFKVGDVVVCNTDINPSSFTQGNSYTIIESREGSVPGYIHMIDDEGEYNGWKTVFFDLVPIENITTVDTKTGEVMEFKQVKDNMTQDEYLTMFQELQALQFSTTKKKNSDYTGGDTSDPFKNFRSSEAFGVSVEKGFMCRMSDKWMRLCGLISGHKPLVKESIEDTLLDMSTYCLLLICYLRGKK